MEESENKKPPEPICIECGSPTIEETRADGVTAWRCLRCGQIILDGVEAAWNDCVQQCSEARLYVDRKGEICAMVGKDPVQGVAGYGRSAPEALRDLAGELIRCGVWIEVPIERSRPPGASLRDTTLVCNEVKFYRDLESGETRARIGDFKKGGVVGSGDAVPDALKKLADELIANGVWVEVTDPDHPFNWDIPPQIIQTEHKADAEDGPKYTRCRGAQREDGTYSGCVYGRGELTPLTGPCDCPVCHGSGFEGVTATWVPHCDFGELECAGFLYGIVRAEQGFIECNDCDATVRAVPAAELHQALNENGKLP